MIFTLSDYNLFVVEDTRGIMLTPFLATVTETLTVTEVNFNGKAEDGEFIPLSRLEMRINSSVKLLSINFTAFSHSSYFPEFILFAFWQLPPVCIYI